MMTLKNWAFSLAILLPAIAWAQPKNETIEYFTDDEVRDTRFSFQLLYAPEYASRRLALYEPVQDGNEIYALTSEDAGAVYGQRIGLMSYFELREMFHLGVGFTTINSGFVTKGFAAFDQNAVFQDTIANLPATTRFEAIAVPIQIIFHTQMNDVWALQVVPSYDLIFMQKIERQWESGAPNYATDAVSGALGLMYQRGSQTKYHNGFNGAIGFAMGNEFRVANDLVFTLRGEFRFGLSPINNSDIGLREIPYSVGGSMGFRYYL